MNKFCEKCGSKIENGVCTNCQAGAVNTPNNNNNKSKYIVIAIVAFLAIGVIFSAINPDNNASSTNDGGQSTSGSEQSTSGSEEKTTTASKKKSYGFDEKFTFDDLEITIGKDYSFTKIKNQFSDDNGKDVVKLPVTVKNLKDETHGLNMFYYTVYGSKGTKADSKAAYFDESLDFGGDLRSGASYTKYMYFLYDGDGEYAIEFSNFSSKVTAEFDIKK